MEKHLHEADILLWNNQTKSQAFPQALASKRPVKGESWKMMNDQAIIACKWHDKRDVYMVSTNSEVGDTEVNVRSQRRQVTMQVPNLILLHNRHNCTWVVELTISISTSHTTQFGTLAVAGGNLFWSVMDSYIQATAKKQMVVVTEEIQDHTSVSAV